MDFSTIKITPKKVHGNKMDFLIREITSKKVRGNDVDFSISKITSKKYVEITGNTSNLVFEYQRDIDVESTWHARWVNGL